MTKWVEVCIIDAIKTCNATTRRPGHPKEGEFVAGLKWIGDMVHMEVVLFNWLGKDGPLDTYQKGLIKERHSRNKPRPWRVIAKKNSCSREKVRMDYNNALKRLEDWIVISRYFDRYRIQKILKRFEELDF